MTALLSAKMPLRLALLVVALFAMIFTFASCRDRGLNVRPAQPVEARLLPQEIINKIERGQFREALLDFNPQGLTDVDLPYKVVYDLLNVLVNKRKVKKIFCRDSYNKYPHSYSYTIKICGILIIFVSTGKIDQKKMHDLEQYFKDTQRDEKYLLTAIKELNE